MAQAGFTPLSLYYSTTASAAPTAGNLVNGELAINITDGKLYYKDNLGAVQLIAAKGGNGVTTFSGNTTGLTPSTPTSGAITLGGTLITSNGGTGLSSWTAGDLPYYATGTALSKLGIGTNGQVLTSTGTAPQWSTLSGVAVTTISFGSTGLTPSTPTAGAVTVAGTLATTNGGTGLTSFSANQIFFASSSSAIGQSANLTWNGTQLSTTGFTASSDSSFTSTGALLISKGTAGQQPGSPVTGMIRYNTTTEEFEGYSGGTPSWKSIGGSALSNDTTTATNLYPVFAAATSGTAQNLYTSNAKYLYKPSTGDLQAEQLIANNGIVVNSQVIATSYTIGAGYNASSTGPVTVNGGVTVTVASGSRWVVL